MPRFSSGREAMEGVNALFVDRWSPRGFSKEPIDPSALARIFEAARWAPSAFNEQPWLFYTSNPSNYDEYLNLLVEGNQSWAKSAAVIGFLIGKKHLARNGRDNATYALDCGSAWMSLALQARVEGLYTHGMGGIKRDNVLSYLQLDPEYHTALMGFVIAKKAAVSGDNKTEAPSDRLPLGQIWHS